MKYSFKKRGALLLLAFLICIPPIPEQTFFQPQFHYSQFLAPQSISTPFSPRSLTPEQNEVIEQIFLNPELPTVLEGMVAKLWSGLELQFKSDMRRLSKSKKLSFIPEPLPEVLLNRLVSELLLREIRLYELTYRKKMRSQGMDLGKIDESLEHIREVMPWDGIEVFPVRRNFVLVFKNFVFVLHHEAMSKIEEFQSLVHKKEIFHSQFKGEDFYLTAFQLGEEEIAVLKNRWQEIKLDQLPTSEIRVSVHELEKFLFFIKPSLNRLVQEQNIGLWRLDLDQLFKVLESFSDLSSKTHLEFIQKRKVGLMALSLAKKIAEEMTKKDPQSFLTREIAQKISRFGKSREVSSFNLVDVIKEVLDWKSKAEKDFIFEFSTKETKKWVEGYPLHLEMDLDNLIRKAMSFLEKQGGDKKVFIRIVEKKGGAGQIDIVISANQGFEETLAIAISQPKPLAKTLKLRIPRMEDAVSTIPPDHFTAAVATYLKKVTTLKLRRLLPQKMVDTLFYLNELPDELRKVSDKTSRTLSELAEDEKIEKSKFESKRLRFLTLRTHDKNGDKVLSLNRDIFKGKLKKVSENDLVFLRLITRDPAGNIVEQLVIDRKSRLALHASTLGTVASFNRFLFNARRTFDLQTQTIILDELYLDPQGKGWGRDFYQAQLNTFLKCGLTGVRIREDVISLATLYWALGFKIDWERLAFKERWLKNMAGLLRELRIPVSEEPSSSEEIRGALHYAKKTSRGFEQFLKTQFGEGEDKSTFISKLLESPQDGFVEFLLYRLVSQGRRKVRIEKLQHAFDQFPDAAKQEKEEGLKVLQKIEKTPEDYWKYIQQAETKIKEGLAKSGKTIVYQIDFSKNNGSEDRRKAFEVSQQLLYQYEFGLSLVRSLKKDIFPISKIDFHTVLDGMVPYYIDRKETVVPHYIEDLKRYDQVERYDSFWNSAWEKPNRFMREQAQSFHSMVQKRELPTVHLIQSRIYSEGISDLFFSFPVVQKFLKESNGFSAMGELLIALYHFNPQLTGIILRSSQNNLEVARQALSYFPNSIFAKILDLELSPIPQLEASYKDFMKYDQCHILRLLEPNEIYQYAYSKRVGEIMGLVQPRTLAILLQQSYASSQSNLYEGWIKSPLLSALKKERGENFKQAMGFLKDTAGLNDVAAWKWVNQFFELKTDQFLNPNVNRFVDFVHEKLKREKQREVLGKIYNQQDAYGPFMQLFGGFSSSETENGITSVISEMFQIAEKGHYLLGTIFRSTPNTQDWYTNQILFKLAHKFPDLLVQLLDQEFYFVPPVEVESFHKENRFVFLIFLRNMLMSAQQDDSIVSPEMVQRVLNQLKSESVAALIQLMWHNATNQRFHGIEENLRQVISLVDLDKHENIFSVLLIKDEAYGTQVKKWCDRVLGKLHYSDAFWEQMKKEWPQFTVESDLSREDLFRLIKEFKEKLEGVKDPLIEETMRILQGSWVKLIEGGHEERALAYGKIKMEFQRLLGSLVTRYEEKELLPQQKTPFLFLLLDVPLSRYFKNDVEKNGIGGFEAINPSRSKILRAKVVLDRPEYRDLFETLRIGDLLITNGLPENNPNVQRPGGVIQGVPVSTNGHAHELAKELGIPFGFLDSAHETLLFLDQKIVVYEVNGSQGKLRLANEEEIKEFERNPDKDKQVAAFTSLKIPDVSIGENERATLNLNEMGPNDRTRVGFKPVRLARWKKSSSSSVVPDGFCVTYEGYESFLKHNGISEKLNESLSGIDSISEQEIKKRLEKIQELFTYGEFPEQLKKEIKAELQKLGDVDLFIRSTSNVEDLPGFSGAGRLDSFGPVRNENEILILSKIKQVMLSLWKENAFNSRKVHGVRGIEHTKAKAAVLIQKAVDAEYSGLFCTHRGDSNQIEVTIDEKVKGGVEDKVEGRTAPTLMYNQKGGKLVRKFQDHPLYWEDSSIGIAPLLIQAKKMIPDEEKGRRAVSLLVEQGVEALKSYLNEQKIENVDAVVESLSSALTVLNQQQIKTIFKPLFDLGKEIEKEFQLEPILVEFAINKEGGIVPLQVKGHEGARKISFRVKVLNVQGMHLTPITSLLNLLKRYSSQNKIIFKKISTNEEIEVKTAFDFMMLELPKGENVEVVVMGKEALSVGKIIRHFFMNLSNDYDGEEELKNPNHCFISWDEVERIFGSYIEEDDTEHPVPWDDMREIWKIHEKIFTHQLQEILPEIEMAI